MTRSLLHAPAFDTALAGGAATLLDSDGDESDLPVRRWHGPADADDAWLLDRCTGPTVDLGCGPGRLLEGLARRGVPALGVDHSAVSQTHCRAREVVMVRRDVFARIPGEGRWGHVVLADGNIGIGGDPTRLLVRATRLLTAGGTLLVETDPAPEIDWRGSVQVRTAAGSGRPTRWARVGADVLGRLAAPLGLAVVAERPGQRAFVELRR